MPEEPLNDVVLPVAQGRAPDPAAPGAQLRRVRSMAREAAAQTLVERGFVHTVPEGHWIGTLFLPRSAKDVPVEVCLPPTFPDALPKVAVSPERLPRRVPHVGPEGTLCLAPSTNVLLDADRPEELVAFALGRAIGILDAGLLGENDGDLDAEFQAYWLPTDGLRVLSLCDADGLARRIVVYEITGGPELINSSWLVADRLEEIAAWAENVGARAGSLRHGLYLPVNCSVPLSPPGQETTIGDVAGLMAQNGTPGGLRLFHDAIERAEFPQLVVFSMPEALPNAGRRLVAVLLRRPAKPVLERAARGFRPGRTPAARLISTLKRDAVGRLAVGRVDRAYLISRGGAATRLAQSTVTIVGVGAVGSEVARNLAALGVGRLRLVDHDRMRPENVHRHVLGMNRAGAGKAEALSAVLRGSFPHLHVEFKALRVEDLIEREALFLLDADLIVLATGEETLERRMNGLLRDGPPRVHTWLEPLGIAGHAFACAGGDGCFECLYRRDELYGLTNRAALSAPGQHFGRSVAGCAGTFAPFSPLDARRTAVDAAELAARVLSQSPDLPTLVTWRGLRAEFEAERYQLSKRAALFAPGARVEIAGAELAAEGCSVCGAGRQNPIVASEVGL